MATRDNELIVPVVDEDFVVFVDEPDRGVRDFCVFFPVPVGVDKSILECRLSINDD